MTRLDPNQAAFARTLRALAFLLRYPDAAWRGHLSEAGEVLREAGALQAARLAQIDALIRAVGAAEDLSAQAAYVELFDRGRGTSLHLFEHVHGDSRERGPAMLDLIDTYERAGLRPRADELPDHLTVLLEYASTQPREAAVALLREVAHILQRIHGAIDKRGSAYASVLGALLDLAGAGVAPAAHAPGPEPDLDEAWAEPAAFDGCGNAGQQAAEPPRTIHIVRRAAATAAAAAPGASQGARA
jgi:nitrate reductase delta subunit